MNQNCKEQFLKIFKHHKFICCINLLKFQDQTEIFKFYNIITIKVCDFYNICLKSFEKCQNW